jgi:hypothetical protein
MFYQTIKQLKKQYIGLKFKERGIIITQTSDLNYIILRLINLRKNRTYLWVKKLSKQMT